MRKSTEWQWQCLRVMLYAIDTWLVGMGWDLNEATKFFIKQDEHKKALQADSTRLVAVSSWKLSAFQMSVVLGSRDFGGMAGAIVEFKETSKQPYCTFQYRYIGALFIFIHTLLNCKHSRLRCTVDRDDYCNVLWIIPGVIRMKALYKYR